MDPTLQPRHKPKVVLIERRGSHSVSIERVFRQVVREIGDREFEIEFQSVPYGNGVFAIIKNLLFFRPATADVYHVTGDVHYIALRLPGRKTLLTVHDLVSLRRRTGLRRWLLKKLFFDLPLERVRYVSVISDTTAEELRKISPKQARVIESPLIDGFDPGPERGFDAELPVILHVGSAENKNLGGLIAAVQGLRCRLRIVGRLSENHTAALGSRNIDYENVSGLDEQQMVEEYRNSDILYFCSTYEGFGLPIIEAQAMRKPVVTSDLDPMRSAAGKDGAALADPFDPASIREAIEKVITDAEYRERLVRNGEENVKRFRTGKAGEAYARIYREIVRENSREI